MTKRPMSIWQFTLLLTITYLLGLFVTHQTTVMENVYWSGYELQEKNHDGVWIDGNRFNIGTQDRIQNLRFNVTIDDSEKWQRPVGLMLGGPFSAEIFWNEEKIGDKGKVGKSRDEEIPGPIDSITFIPSRLLTPGEHHIRIRLSTQHLVARDETVFHSIWLAPYRDSGRRDLRYYSAPLLILSALIVLSIQSFRIGYSAGNEMHFGLGLFGFSTIVLLISEISRAVINYPYHYHELRGIFGWLGNTGAGAALMYTCYRMSDGRLTKIILLAGIGIVSISHLMPMKSGDMRLTLDFILLTLAPAMVFFVLLVKRQVSYLSTLPLFWLACVVSNTLSIGLFLDSFQFIASLILIGGAWLWVYVDFNHDVEQQPELTNSKQFVIRAPGEEKIIPVADCFALKGEGNYTSLMLSDGSSVLHQDGLGAIMNTHPVDFVRVHKSYAVNINAVKKLKSASGSKYWLELNNNETIPVSRYRVVELRGLLKEYCVHV